MEQMNAKCPIEIAISVIGTKWKVQILGELVQCEKTGMRFTDFKKSITGISDKMLSQSLKELERDHLVDRKLIDDSPPRTEYSLTEMGQSMNTVLSSLYDWGSIYKNVYGSEENKDAK